MRNGRRRAGPAAIDADAAMAPIARLPMTFTVRVAQGSVAGFHSPRSSAMAKRPSEPITPPMAMAMIRLTPANATGTPGLRAGGPTGHN